MNIQPYISINDVDSRSITGLLISSLAPISKPIQRTQIEEIDGRDGDIITPLGYAAYDKVVKIGLTYNYDIDKIIDYFNSSGRVVFSNEPDKYYNFGIYEQIDFERLIRFKTADVVFHVQPFKYSNIEEPVALGFFVSPATVSVYNAGNYFARPIIKIRAKGVVGLSLNGSAILNIDFGEDYQKITIDCEAMNAYDEQNTLVNRLVTGNYDNIRLIKGQNTIVLTGNVRTVEISKYTRWL